jgi:hypothetical protein
MSTIKDRVKIVIAGSPALSAVTELLTPDIYHGELDGLDDPEDHLWAILVSGERPFEGDQSMGGHSLTNILELSGRTDQDLFFDDRWRDGSDYTGPAVPLAKTQLEWSNFADEFGPTASILGAIRSAADSGGIEYTAGLGIDIESYVVYLDHLGIEDLTDPGADRIYFWKDSANATEWLQLGTNLSITGNTLNASGGATTPALTQYAIGVGSASNLLTGYVSVLKWNADEQLIVGGGTPAYISDTHYSVYITNHLEVAQNFNVSGLANIRAGLHMHDTHLTDAASLCVNINTPGLSANEMTINWLTSTYAGAPIAGDLTSFVFSYDPPGSTVCHLHIYNETAGSLDLSGFPSNVFWGGAHDLTSGTYTLPSGHWVHIRLYYDADESEYYATAIPQYGDYEVGGSLDAAYRYDLPNDSHRVYADTYPMTIIGYANISLFALSQSNTANTSELCNVYNTSNNAGGARTFYLDGAAGAVDTLGHRFAISDDSISVLSGSESNGLLSFLNVYQDSADGVDFTSARMRAQNGDASAYAYWSATANATTGTLYGKSTGDATLNADDDIHITADDTVFINAGSNLIIDTSGYTSFNSNTIRYVKNLSYGLATDTDTWSTSSQSVNFATGTPFMRALQSTDVTTVTLTRPNGCQVCGIKISASTADRDIGNASGCFKDATTAATFINWLAGDGNPDTEVITIPSGTVCDISIRYENVSGTPVATGIVVLQ